MSIRFTWKGHSCYIADNGGYKVVFDPFRDGAVPGYDNIRLSADRVICSHEHRDHIFKEGVEIVPSGLADPYTVTEIECPHDDAGGTLRGMNIITVLDDGKFRFAHFGDIGCPLDEGQRAEIGKLDLALVPVGGHFTMEPDGIYELMEQLGPRVVVPMHYRNGALGYPVIGTLDAYLKYVKGDIREYDTNTFVLDEDTPAQTAVLKYLG